MDKKLQIFISSTYTDLISERQSAVQAILNAGHIPAGMELFTDGSESQLETIYNWIDNSDIYMLILGGRYGSIEPKSRKSYTQLEYEYAVAHNIPFFALVLSDKFLDTKIKESQDFHSILEQQHPREFNDFKELVTSKIVEFVDDEKDIQLGILKALNAIQQHHELRGWIRPDSVPNITFLSQTLQNLTSENEALKSKLAQQSDERFGDFSFDDLVNIFSNKEFEIPEDVVYYFSVSKITALQLFTLKYGTFCTGVTSNATRGKTSNFFYTQCFPYFESYGLTALTPIDTYVQRFQVTDLGRKFFAHYDAKKHL